MDRSRVMVLTVLLLLPFVGLEARLVQLQLIDAQDYLRTGARRRSTIELASAPRGRILDRHG